MGTKKITLGCAKAAVFIGLSLGMWLTGSSLVEAENKRCLLGPWHCLLSVCYASHSGQKMSRANTQTWRQQSYAYITVVNPHRRNCSVYLLYKIQHLSLLLKLQILRALEIIMGTLEVAGGEWGVVFLTVSLISFLLDSLSFWIKVSSASSNGQLFSTSALTTYLWACEQSTIRQELHVRDVQRLRRCKTRFYFYCFWVQNNVWRKNIWGVCCVFVFFKFETKL